jgi:hypothetical protein
MADDKPEAPAIFEVDEDDEQVDAPSLCVPYVV